MGEFIGIGALINKNTFEGGRLFGRGRLLEGLRRLLFTANRTMVSKFPTTTNTNTKRNAVHNAMPSALKGTILDEPVAFSELLVAASVLIIF